MNARAVLFVLGNLLSILALAMLAPLGLALFDEPSAASEAYAEHEVRAFVIAIGLAASIGLALRYFFRKHADGVRQREGFAIVTFSWLLLSLVGMLPYLLSGVTDSITDAFFETMSGFTTTGATIFPEVEIMPPGIMLWRCMTQWLGGMGVVVLSVALLPILGVGGYRLLKAETPGGVTYERDRARITDAAKDLWKLYLILSVAQTMALLVAGMSLFDAICHTFTTMSTGGFSTHTESAAFFQSGSIQWILILFMFLAGANFTLHSGLLKAGLRIYRQNSEFRLYTITMLMAVAMGMSALLASGGGAGFSERLVRDVTFQVVSIGTTTGYATADYNLWPHVMRFGLFLLMFTGGCMGSTAGGMKFARALIYIKVVLRELHRMVYPRGVRHVRVGAKVIEPRVASNIMAFGVAYMGFFLFGTLVMVTFDYGLVTSMSASAAALGNIGPGLVAVGPTANWAHLPDVAKWVMSFLMLLGRLELFSVLVLFTGWAWRR